MRIDGACIVAALAACGPAATPAIDNDWATLRSRWLDGHERSYTSVGFLIDKAGVVRRVHVGGLLAPEGDDIKAIDADIERLLAQESG